MTSHGACMLSTATPQSMTFMPYLARMRDESGRNPCNFQLVLCVYAARMLQREDSTNVDR